MRSFLILVLIFCSSLIVRAQLDITANLEAESKAMIKAIVEEDYPTYLDLSYPPVVKMFGGRAAMMEMTKSNKEAQKEGGMVLKSASFAFSGAPVTGENTLQAIVAFDYIMDIAGSDYKGMNYLLAISTNEGVNWTFVELETFDKESIKDFVPEYNEALRFPEIKGAVFIENK